ncbi:hypothetical protein [Jatrophihabitans sp.]|jgi:hypothetical protein|uniref:hypothetical protein n=1 Tax=Jatrophihabitans sp. TaxID=1932789 RepID=UPI002EEC827D
MTTTFRRGAPWDTLSTRQVNVLLRAVDLHQGLIESSHHDARRELRYHKTPAYLVDFQLVWRYIYDESGIDIDRVLELDYLFGHGDIPILIGLGTHLEIRSNLRRRTGIDTTSSDFRASTSLTEYLSALSNSRRQNADAFLRRAPRESRALERLHDLLRRPNVRRVEEVAELRVDYDQQTFDIAQRYLNATRPTLTDNNLADAINLGQVVALRLSDYPYYPFLLTDADLILDDGRFAGDVFDSARAHRIGISRTPLTAIYSRVASSVYGDPRDAITRTNWLALAAERCRFDLRECRGYLEEVVDASEDEWRSRVANEGLGGKLLEELGDILRFVEDPLITETQRLYDSLRMKAVNMGSHRGASPSADSPRRVFDLILGISRSLEAGRRGATTFDEMWSSAIKVAVKRFKHFVLLSFVDAAGAEYLYVERHESHFVLRWPTAVRSDRLLATLSDAFARSFAVSGDHDVIMQAGVQDDILEFATKFPVTVDELIDACGVMPSWVRFNSKPFDLYADILSQSGVTPLVGILTDSPDWRLIAELYTNTSARFIFQAWLNSALAFCRADFEEMGEDNVDFSSAQV